MRGSPRAFGKTYYVVRKWLPTAFDPQKNRFRASQVSFVVDDEWFRPLSPLTQGEPQPPLLLRNCGPDCP
jgi:hypothetical protein